MVHEWQVNNEIIIRTRQYYIDLCNTCIREALEGSTRVNDLFFYIQWQKRQIERIESGFEDNTFTFLQHAHYMQTGQLKALLP